MNNLYINRPSTTDVGLVGYLDTGGIIENIGVNIAPGGIEGNFFVGGLAGQNEGTISGYVNGDIAGTAAVGGIAGLNIGTINGYALGSVTGNGSSGFQGSYIGGLTGRNTGTITGYTANTVSGNNSIGGLAGENDGYAEGYAVGNISGNGSVGGLAGSSNSGTLRGYARGNIIRKSGSMNTMFGRVAGFSTETGFYSAKTGESELYEEGTAIDQPAISGITSSAISVDPFATGYEQAIFTASGTASLTFGTGKWTFNPGQWPALTLPAAVGGNYDAANQPTQP